MISIGTRINRPLDYPFFFTVLWKNSSCASKYWQQTIETDLAFLFIQPHFKSLGKIKFIFHRCEACFVVFRFACFSFRNTSHAMNEMRADTFLKSRNETRDRDFPTMHHKLKKNQFLLSLSQHWQVFPELRFFKEDYKMPICHLPLYGLTSSPSDHLSSWKMSPKT